MSSEIPWEYEETTEEGKYFDKVYGPTKSLDYEWDNRESNNLFILPNAYEHQSSISGIRKRHLQGRSLLKFYFQDAEGIKLVYLPFYENIIVAEDKEAKYAKYSPFGRSSQLYAYMGADSRKFRVSFSMTLPHLMERHKEINPAKTVTLETDTASEMAKFFTEGGLSGKDAYSIKNVDSESGQVTSFTGAANDGTAKFLDEEFARISGDMSQATPTPSDQMQVRRNLIDVISYWVNIIRSSVINNAGDPLYGPPIVRLNHGILYREVPCIVTKYAISYPDKGGFDLNTLLPRIITITLNMEEVRTGNFGNFSIGDFAARDNLAGWESVVHSGAAGHTLDPQPANSLNYVPEGGSILQTLPEGELPPL